MKKVYGEELNSSEKKLLKYISEYIEEKKISVDVIFLFKNSSPTIILKVDVFTNSCIVTLLDIVVPSLFYPFIVA